MLKWYKMFLLLQLDRIEKKYQNKLDKIELKFKSIQEAIDGRIRRTSKVA